jgi:hypothetical protein
MTILLQRPSRSDIRFDVSFSAGEEENKAYGGGCKHDNVGTREVEGIVVPLISIVHATVLQTTLPLYQSFDTRYSVFIS